MWRQKKRFCRFFEFDLMVAASMACIYSLVGVGFKLICGPILVCGGLDFGLQCKHVVDQFFLNSISTGNGLDERIYMWGRSLIGVRETMDRSGETFSTGTTDVPSGEKRNLELLRS